jgi:hypothetical protein
LFNKNDGLAQRKKIENDLANILLFSFSLLFVTFSCLIISRDITDEKQIRRSTFSSYASLSFKVACVGAVC